MTRLAHMVCILTALAGPVAAQTTEARVGDDIFQVIADGDAGRAAAILAAHPQAVLARDAAGRTPLMLAAYMGQEALVSILRGAHPAPDFFEACILGEEAIARAALAAGQSADAFSADGFTCLGLAVFFRQPAVARMLVEAGADVNLPSRNAQMVGPVHAAVARQDAETLALLLARGADPDAPQQNGVRPIHDAAAGGNAAIVALLLMYGADPGAATGEGKTAAALAAERGHPDLAAKLEEAAAL